MHAHENVAGRSIAAATINGAWALRLADRKGSIEPGRDADLAIFDVEDYREIPYWFASNRCALTVLNGVIASLVELLVKPVRINSGEFRGLRPRGQLRRLSPHKIGDNESTELELPPEDIS